MSAASLHRPIAVFDAGIGSYAIVAEIQRRLPQQDIVYFADRASFPYGDKAPAELAEIMRRTLAFLETFDPSAIVVASNAPSITVFDEIKPLTSTPVYGVFPPLEEAITLSTSKRVGIMGVRSLIESEMLDRFVRDNDEGAEHVATINASSMVELVESGALLFSPQETQAQVNDFVARIFEQDPAIDVLTLSSTHLPWLRPFFERTRPECHFLDPAESIVASLGQGEPGSGIVRGFVTEDERYSVEALRRMLARLDVEIPLEVVSL